MTVDEMLDRMSNVEIAHRLALDRIKVRERERAERMAKAKRRR